MLGYVLKRGDSPESVAAQFGGTVPELIAANRVNPRLRQHIVNSGAVGGAFASQFFADDWREGTVLLLPEAWRNRAGVVSGAPGTVGAVPNWWCWDQPYFKQCMDGALVLAQTNCAPFGAGTPEYNNCVDQAKTAGQQSCVDWCNANYPTAPAAKCSADADCPADQYCSGGQCVPGPQQGNESANPLCNSPEYIKKVQAALGVKVDGLWGCESQKALDYSEIDYKNIVGSSPCDGPAPYKAGCSGGGGTVPPVVKKRKEGESCTKPDDCEAGLTCIDGKCAKPPVTEDKKSTSSIWPWVLIGLGVAGAVVGVAYASGDDKKGKRGAEKTNPARHTLNNADREQWIDNDEGLYTWWKSSRLSKREFIRQNKAEIDSAILGVLNRPPREKTWRDYR